MILGRIVGKTTTLNFSFLVTGNPKKFQYVQIMHKTDYILAQITEIEKDSEKTLASCNIIGYRKEGRLLSLSTPLEPGNEVLIASDDFINETLNLKKTENSAYMGNLQDYPNVKIYLDLNKMLNKHIAILAKTGSGKCISRKTKIFLEDGSGEEIGKIVDRNIKDCSYFEEDVEISKINKENLKVYALNQENNIVKTKIKAFTRRKYNENLILIKTRSGKEIEVTAEHQMPTLNEFIFWKNANQLNKGDFLLIPMPQIRGNEQIIDIINIWKEEYGIKVKNKEINEKIKDKLNNKKLSLKEFSKNFKISYSGFQNWFNEGIPIVELIKMCELLNLKFNEIKKEIDYLYANTKRIPSKIKIDKDFAKLFAYFLAEGHNSGKTMIFTNSDLEIQKEFLYLTKKIFDIEPLKPTPIEFRINNKYLSKTFQRLGFTNSSWTKFIPKEIMISKIDIIFSFLEGFVDCDGHLAKNTPSLEISLASKRLIEDLEIMFMRFNIVPIKKYKKVNNRLYPKITIYGSKNFRILSKNLDFKIKYKKERLDYFSRFKSNPNIEVIPNISENLKVITNILNMHESESRIKTFHTYIRKEKCPSIETLKKLLEDIEEKYCFIDKNIKKAISIYEKLPKINEEYALNYIKEYHSSGLTFHKLSQEAVISEATIRRMVFGITNLTNNIYPLAQNALKLINLKDKEIEYIVKIDHIEILKEIKDICLNLGYGISSLCFDIKHSKTYIYNNITNERNILYSELLKFGKRLEEIALSKAKELQEVKFRLSFLKSLIKNNLYFDEIISIEKINYDDYVYDLETEEHNFIANNILIHNSYVAGVLLEELLELNIPLLILDPHSEYSSLKYPSNDVEKLAKFGLKPKAYLNKIQEYSVNTEDNPDSKKLKLSMYNISAQNLMQLLPAKLSNIQQTILYTTLKELQNPDFDSLIAELDLQDNPAKFSLLNIIDYIKKLDIFSNMPTSLQELIQPGKCSILNLKGLDPDVQEVVVYKLLYDLFEARKKANIPPFFLVIEEAHNFIPERSFGEVKSSKIIRQISAEGRKFGLGLCIITQRPSRIEKSVLSQCNTQIILKVTNPNDITSIVNSVEGITSETKEEIKNLTIGTAMLTGIIDVPLFTEIRPRMTKHGGESVNIASMSYKNIEEGELLNIIKQNYSLEDVKIMNENKEVKTILTPCLLLNCNDFNILINLNNGEIIKDLETGKGIKITSNVELSPQQKRIFDIALTLKEFTAAEIFSRSQVQFSEIYDTLNSFIQKNYIAKEGAKYKVTNSFNINFSEYISYAKPEYAKVKYDKILDKTENPEQLKHFLQTFLKIKSSKECFLVKYEI